MPLSLHTGGQRVTYLQIRERIRTGWRGGMSVSVLQEQMPRQRSISKRFIWGEEAGVGAESLQTKMQV